MTINFFLLTSEVMNDEGFPLVVRVSHGGNVPIKRQIARAFPDDFSDDTKMVKESHPDFDILAPMMMDMKLKARKIVLRKETDQHKAMAELFEKDTSGATLMEFFKVLSGQMEQLAKNYSDLGDVKAAKKVRGNLKVYQNTINQFTVLIKDIPLTKLDYPTLLRFRNYQLGLGNSKNTVHQYLRTLRAIYNKGQLFYGLPANKPFEGVFSGLSVKSYANKKKYITKEAIAILEGLEFQPALQQYLDLWLLSFYFGGADLNDMYYLKKAQLRKGRIYFERGKTDNPLLIDLAVHPKAKAIIERYKSDDEWLFPWRKDEKGYESFRRRYQRVLIDIQEGQNEAVAAKKAQLGKCSPEQESALDAQKIEVLPTGGNLGVKVARHAFGNIGKQLMIESDILRELMGHERNDVDNFYKDKYPQAVRDEALFRIIG